jgi:N-ethylmaleimide reductase
MSDRKLFSSYTLGSLTLPNRVVMAPLTRSRATGTGFVPTPLMAEYYAQRASAGLIISEGTPVSAQARGYAYTPGIYKVKQVFGWQQVTDAVHRRGGRIVLQLWHCGRISHHSLREDGSPPVGPSTVAAQSNTYGRDPHTGAAILMPCDPPRALSTAEVKAVVADFAQAARNALTAGFDGVEIHGANGYLFDQFRCPFLNDRTDAYGGSLENRCRLLLETGAAVSEAVGPVRVGVRLSPLGLANDMRPDPEPLDTYGYLARELDHLGIGYLHLNDQSTNWAHDATNPLLRGVRAGFSRTLILCGGFTSGRAEAALQADSGDLIAFGKLYISNPDLVERLRGGLELAPYDTRTFYAGGASGYVDYPPFTA